MRRMPTVTSPFTADGCTLVERPRRADCDAGTGRFRIISQKPPSVKEYGHREAVAEFVLVGRGALTQPNPLQAAEHDLSGKSGIRRSPGIVGESRRPADVITGSARRLPAVL